MASVKNIKSKSKGNPGHCFFDSDYGLDYFYRRYSYRLEPPAKVCRPLRYIARWAQKAADTLYRGITIMSRLGVPAEDIREKLSEEFSDYQYRSNYLIWVQRCAARGHGDHVQRMTHGVN